MGRIFVFLIALLAVVSFAKPAVAQSSPVSREQLAVYKIMDATLEGYWEGHAGANDGMKYDPKAISCMVNKCSILNAAKSTVAQLRDARNFRACYDAHLARVSQPGYTRLANPPSISVLGCDQIAVQANSTDDRVYAAVNGRARFQPSPQIRTNKRFVQPTAEERAYLLAQMTKAPAASSSGGLQNANPRADVTPKPVVSAPSKPAKVAKSDSPRLGASAPVVSRPLLPSSRGPRASGGNPLAKQHGDLGDKLVLISQDDDKAMIYVKPGGQFYTIRASYLAEKYDTDWKTVYGANQYADVIGACWRGDKVELDQERMSVKAWQHAKLIGPTETKFMDACDGEFNFALQAGQTIVLAAKSDAPPKKEQAETPPLEQATAGTSSPAPLASATASAVPVQDLPLIESATAGLPDPTGARSGEVAGEASSEPPPAQTPPADSAVAPLVSAPPLPSGAPPDSSGHLNVTVLGTKRPVAPAPQSFSVWFKGWPSNVTIALAVVLFVLMMGIGLRKNRQSHVTEGSRWGASPTETTVILGLKKTSDPKSGDKG